MGPIFTLITVTSYFYFEKYHYLYFDHNGLEAEVVYLPDPMLGLNFILFV